MKDATLFGPDVGLKMSFSIPGKQAESLSKAILDSFPRIEELHVWVEFNLEANLNHLKTSDVFQMIVLDLFRWIETRKRWPEFLRAGSETKRLPQFADACQAALKLLPEIGPRPPATDERDLLMWGEAPFIDRHSFWIDIQELRTSAHKRVITVDGPPKSGKSYCGELLDHQSHEKWPDSRLVLIDLNAAPSPDIKPDELCRRLLVKLQRPEAQALLPPLPNQKPDNWARDLGSWAADKIAQIGQEVWVVVDGLKQVSTEETHVFIATLAEEARDKDFRLVLLDYDRTFGGAAGRATRQTRIEHLTAAEVQEFLDAFARQYAVQESPEWAAALEVVVEYARLPPGSTTQVEVLAKLLPDILRAFV